MTTQIDICNLALGRLGDEATVSSIDPPDDSVQANHCSWLYPIALLAALDKHNWRFATLRFLLPSRSNEADEWQYCYGIPSDYVSLIKLTTDGIDDVDEYSIEIASDDTQVLYTNVEAVTLVYCSSDVSPARFSPAFVEYFSALLASHLAGPLLKGDVGASAAGKFLELSRALLGPAIERDGQNYRQKSGYVPKHIAARQ